MVAGFTRTQRGAIYTCIGDTVNLASRLESYTKEIGQPIPIDGETREGLGASVAVEDQNTAVLKGETRAVHVYSVPCGMS